MSSSNALHKDSRPQINHYFGSYLLQITLVNQEQIIIVALDLSSGKVPAAKLTHTIKLQIPLSPFVCYQKAEDLLEFFTNPYNIGFNPQKKTLKLKWFVNANGYEKKIKSYVNFEEQPLTVEDELRFENYLLRKRLAKYQGQANSKSPIKGVLTHSPSKVSSENYGSGKVKSSSQGNIKGEQKKRGRTIKEISAKNPEKTKPIQKPSKGTKKSKSDHSEPEDEGGWKKDGKYLMKYKRTVLGDQKEQLKSKNPVDRKVKGMVLEFENGDVYEGGTIDEIYQGFGIYKSHSGSYYQGNWVDGKAQGLGSSVDAQGNKYIGNFFNDMRHGHGEQIYTNGEKYKGTFEEDKKCGKGKYYYENGDVYEGEWKEDVCWGKGRETYTDGSYYEGVWYKDEKHGPGELIDSNGEKAKKLYNMGELLPADGDQSQRNVET